MRLQRIQEISGKLSSRESAGNAFKGQTRNIQTILSFRPLKERSSPRIRETMAYCTLPMSPGTRYIVNVPGNSLSIFLTWWNRIHRAVLLDAEIDTREFAAARVIHGFKENREPRDTFNVRKSNDTLTNRLNDNIICINV